MDLAALLILDAGPKFQISCLCLICQSGDCSPTGRRGVCFPVDQLCLLWIVLTSYLFQTLTAFHGCNRMDVCSTATSLKWGIGLILSLSCSQTAVRVFQLVFPLGKVSFLSWADILSLGLNKISISLPLCVLLSCQNLPWLTQLLFCPHFQSFRKILWLATFWIVGILYGSG